VIKKVLIANRGEIAVRVLRALKDMGLGSVAVFSEADRAARHVRLADEAYCIGPAPSAQSYLQMDTIIEVAIRSGAQAIHPGYGFLSENAAFSQRCRDAGIAFIGPPPAAIHAMGEKTRARQIMAKAGVPVIPGTLQPLADAESALEAAQMTGYPVMLKAAAGGGGKGMRLVHDSSALPAAFRDASSEAVKSFGDGSVYLERAVVRPRHIEVQILADAHGNCIYLGERECSIQRRHQKVVEEAPSPFVKPEMRRMMGEVAVKAAQAVGYVNAGTIEFLVDQSGEFFFMEMNTRLQVEHAVTEMVTGIDLVREQIQIADGKPLGMKQEDVSIRGWSMECRIYAEDPLQNFMPCPGRIEAVRLPEGPNVRVDSAAYTRGEVSMFYDPMVAKVITWGSDRDACAATMNRALMEFQIVGTTTNRDFLLAIIDHPEFRAGRLDTGFIERYFGGPSIGRPDPAVAADIAAAIYALESSKRSGASAGPVQSQPSAWRRALQGRG
jgi:acetyl-CoA carboxylase, biotin carboxylase subunit